MEHHPRGRRGCDDAVKGKEEQGEQEEERGQSLHRTSDNPAALAMPEASRRHGAGTACGVAVTAAVLVTLMTAVALLFGGGLESSPSTAEFEPMPSTPRLLRSAPALAMGNSPRGAENALEGLYRHSDGIFGQEGTGVGVGAADSEVVAREAWMEEPVSRLLEEVLSVVGPTGEGLLEGEAGESRGGDGGWGDDGWDGGDQDVEGGARRLLTKWEGHHRCFMDKNEKERCHANVFFFGISKCGTTSFARWLSKHPSLRWVMSPHPARSPGGEAHVFDASIQTWHRRIKSGRFGDYGLTAPEASEEDRVMDYTPHYATMAEVPYRIIERYGRSSFQGGVKYVVLLREPAARTISSWQFKFDLRSLEVNFRGDVSEHRSLVDVIEEGQKRVAMLMECRNKLMPKMSRPSDMLKMDLLTCNPRKFLEHNMYVSHIGKSMYAEQLERWFTLFGRNNIKVVFLEDMAVDPIGTLENVFEYMGLDLLDEEGKNGLPSREDWERIVKISHNQTDEKKKLLLGDQVTPEIVESLREYFAPHNSRLQELLGQPLPSTWTTSSPEA